MHYTLRIMNYILSLQITSFYLIEKIIKHKY